VIHKALRVAAQRPRSVSGVSSLAPYFTCKARDLRVGLPGLEPGTSSLSGRLPDVRTVSPRPESPLRLAVFLPLRESDRTLSIAAYRPGWCQRWCQAATLAGLHWRPSPRNNSVDLLLGCATRRSARLSARRSRSRLCRIPRECGITAGRATLRCPAAVLWGTLCFRRHLAPLGFVRHC